MTVKKTTGNPRAAGMIILPLLLCLVMALSGCKDFVKLIARQIAEGKTTTTGDAGVPADTTDGSGSTETAGGEPVSADEFAAAFQPVASNPLQEDIRVELWLAAQNPPQATEPGQGSSAEMTLLNDKRKALIAGPGLHYIEENGAMGMTFATEYWVRGDRYKKVETDKVAIFDGKSYIEYDPAEKTGYRYTKEYMAAEIQLQFDGMLSSLAKASYERLDDQLVNDFSCAVFFMDIEVMGMKGNTLFVDQETGVLIKYLIGSEDDGFATVVTLLETGGFSDDVFMIPDDVVIEDWK